jgi:hypothetical protein
VRSKEDNQFVVTQIAIAELRSCCLKHSAQYMDGIGPKPTAKLIIKITIQAIDKFAKIVPLILNVFYLTMNNNSKL